MTIREMYVNAISALQGNEIECSTDELIQMLTERLEKHDAQNEKRKAADRKPSAKELAAREYDAKLMEALQEILTDEFQLRTVFAEALDITPSKASVLLNKMEKAGIVEKGEVKVDGRKAVGYKRAE
jgi:DNA-binding transcriptional ArsR family regulator